MKIVFCGDSFTIGTGCTHKSLSYSGLIADHFASPYLNLAHGGASNYTIFLQFLYACELHPDHIIVNTTSVDRTEWLDKPVDGPLHASQIAYFEDNHHFSNDPHWEQIIMSSPIYNLNHTYGHKPYTGLIESYHLLVEQPSIKKYYDAGLIAQIAQYQAISTIILAQDELFPLLVNSPRIVNIDFFNLASTDPDTLGSGHCSENSHAIVASQIINLIEAL